MRGATSAAWADLTEPVVGLPARLSRSGRIPDFLLFVCITNNDFEFPGLGTTIGEVAAIPLVLLSLARRAERGWSRIGAPALLVTALGGWFLLSGVINHQIPPFRIGHMALYCAVILFMACGRIDVVAAASGIGVGLVIGTVYGYATFGSDYPGRMTGSLGDPNGAGYVLITLGLVYLGLETRRGRRLVVGLATVAGIVGTFSRTTFLAAGMAALWILMPPRVPVAVKGAITAVLFTQVTTVAESMKNQGVFADRQGSDNLRELIYPLEQQIVSSNPLTGHGPGTLTIQLEQQSFFFHSSYLLLRAEGGWILFTLMLATMLVVALRLARPASGIRNKVLEAALLVPLICALNLGNVFLDFPVAVALGAALWWAGAPRDGQADDPPDRTSQIPAPTSLVPVSQGRRAAV